MGMNRRTFLAALPAAVAGLAITDPAALLASSSDAEAIAKVKAWMQSIVVGCELHWESDRGTYRVTSVTEEHGWPVFTFARTTYIRGPRRAATRRRPPPRRRAACRSRPRTMARRW
jgi:hypothetical protein